MYFIVFASLALFYKQHLAEATTGDITVSTRTTRTTWTSAASTPLHHRAYSPHSS